MRATGKPSRASHQPFEQVPLTAFDQVDEESDEDLEYTTREPAATPLRSPKSFLLSKTTRKAFMASVLVLALVFILYQSVIYLYSDPLKWPDDSNSPHSPRETMSVIVNTGNRTYRGRTEENEQILTWRGIRYAEPPIGSLRFRKPVPILASNLTEDAFWMGWGCPRPYWNPFSNQTMEGEEDCLKLNVFAPRVRAPDELLPVMIWIHGGGYIAGQSPELNKLLLRSMKMNRNLILVSINYRLGGLGFSATPPRPAESPAPFHVPIRAPDALDLNVGHKDQLAAIKWVNREIIHFGGDPNKVSLVGHSVGAMSIGLHQIYSPKNLFRAVFMLSGAATSFPVPWPHDAGARTLHPLPGPSQCPSPQEQDYGPPNNNLLIECLRNLSIPDFLKATSILTNGAGRNGNFPYYPVLEGEYEGSWLNVRPSERIQRGDYNKVPVVMGSALDEATAFVQPEIRHQSQILQSLRDAYAFTFGAIEEILVPIWEFYPNVTALGSPYRTGNQTFGLNPTYKRAASLIGDLIWQAPRRFLLRETPNDFGTPSWNYLYTEKGFGAQERFGSQHGADAANWLNDAAEADEPSMKRLSRQMAAYLINFVYQLDPNGPGLRPWPQYGLDRSTLQLARNNLSIIRDDDRLDAIRFLNVNNPLFAR